MPSRLRYLKWALLGSCTVAALLVLVLWWWTANSYLALSSYDYGPGRDRGWAFYSQDGWLHAYYTRDRPADNGADDGTWAWITGPHLGNGPDGGPAGGAHYPPTCMNEWEETQWTSLGLGWYVQGSRFSNLHGWYAYTSRGLLFPHWLAALVLAAAPAACTGRALLRVHRARRRRRLGLCAQCGYDVRTQAHGEGGEQCPECGTPLPLGRP